MNFGSELAAGLSELRGHAESRMRGTCKIERPTGAQNTSPDGVVTDTYVQVYPDLEWPGSHPHADGKCYTRYPGLAQEANREVGGATVVESRIIVSVPFGVIFRPGDRVTILTDLDNPQLAGETYPVESIDNQSQATRQRLLCTDPQSGAL